MDEFDNVDILTLKDLSPEARERTLDLMSPRPIIVDLDWNPDIEIDEESDVQVLSPQTIQHQYAIYHCMDEIQNLDCDKSYTKLQWNEEMANHQFYLFPTQIHMVPGSTGMYTRFWGYVCQLFEDAVDAKRATIPLPSALVKLLGMFNQDIQGGVIDPLNDLTVPIVTAFYLGLGEFEKDGEVRHYHGFHQTRLIEGRRSS